MENTLLSKRFHNATLDRQPTEPSGKNVRCVRLFIADDAPVILDSLTRMFHELAPHVQVAGYTEISALETAIKERSAPNLVLVDFPMKNMDTVAAFVGLLTRFPGCRIAVTSGHADVNLARQLLQVGCAGFIVKTLAPIVIYHAVRLMIGGGIFVPECLHAKAPRSAIILTPPQPKVNLTRREVEVLRCLVQCRSNKQIGNELNIAEVTVKLHLRHIYAKIGVNNRIEAARAVFDGSFGLDDIRLGLADASATGRRSAEMGQALHTALSMPQV